MPDLRDKRVEMILQQLEELPTLPAVAVRVLRVTGDDSSSAADVVRLIGSDPALTSRILQLTRRADRGVRDEVTTVDRAVVLLGFEAVRNAVLAVSVFQTLGGPADSGEGGGQGAGGGGLSSGNQAKRFSREGFWTHSLAVACCAELLAELGGGAHGPAGVTPAEAFLCGLLHDLGKLALDVALPKSYARVIEAADLLRGDIADLERTVIGVDHQVAGKRLAERWQLPAAVRDVAWLHGQPPAGMPAAARGRTVNLVTLADLLVRQQHLGYSGNHAFPVGRESLLAATGLSAGQVDQAVAKLVARMEPRSAALGLGQTTSGDLYRAALAQANQELARVGGQLAAKAKRVGQRAKFFDVLHQFQADLRPDATAQQALSAVAAAAAAFVGVDRVAAFSLPPGKDYAESALCAADGAVLESAFVELPGMAELTAGGAGVTEDEIRAAQELARGATPGAGAGRPAEWPLAASPISPTTTLPPPRSPAPVESAPATDALVLPAGDDVEWFTGALAPKLPGDRRFWLCLQADGRCVGGVAWGASADELDRLRPQAQELSALGHTWSLALRSAQARDESRDLAEDLAAANRRLTSLQAAVFRTRALTTVGEMAAGAAHEMNNPLAVISGRSQLLAAQLADPKQRAAAALVHEQADRLSDIITEMMAFAKPQPPRVMGHEAGHLVSAAVGRAKGRAVPADRDIEVTVGDAPLVGVDAGQVTEALAEVIANALQATAGAGGKPGDGPGSPAGAGGTRPGDGRGAARPVVGPGGGRGGRRRRRDGRRRARGGRSTRSTAASGPAAAAGSGCPRPCGGSRPAAGRSGWRAGPASAPGP